MVKHASSLVVASNFIEATRDSGYKSLGSALAELVDNSFEARATRVAVVIERAEGLDPPEAHLRVSDNGKGMDANTCSNAMRFGWSSRFNQRDSHGRYGMGLPNASLSHARRVEVWSSVDGCTAMGTYLDVDEVVGRARGEIPPATRLSMADFKRLCPFAQGTLV